MENKKFNIRGLRLLRRKADLDSLPEGKFLINTVNAFSYVTALKDEAFAEALMSGDALIPDGASIVKACHWLNSPCQPEERIAGWDLFVHEMERLQRGSTDVLHPVVMFMGSSETVLSLIKERSASQYPGLVVKTYSPPFKKGFTAEDDEAIIKAINEADPDLLWIGMTAPKQEKWAFRNWERLDIHCHCGTVGAVFDFFAGTSRRAPLWWQRHSLEWLYRLLIEPKRMWKRYVLGNAKFLWYVLEEKLGML